MRAPACPAAMRRVPGPDLDGLTVFARVDCSIPLTFALHLASLSVLSPPPCRTSLLPALCTPSSTLLAVQTLAFIVIFPPPLSSPSSSHSSLPTPSSSPPPPPPHRRTSYSSPGGLKSPVPSPPTHPPPLQAFTFQQQRTTPTLFLVRSSCSLLPARNILPFLKREPRPLAHHGHRHH